MLVHKKPELGIGKQRLAAEFGVELTLQIAHALLACAMEDAAMWPGTVILAPANQNDCDWALGQVANLSGRFEVVPQISGNLGQRLNALDTILRKRKLSRLVYIGSDSPGLTEEDFAAVRTGLKQYEAVLTPAADGGVVIMANRRAWPDLSALPWSTDRLGEALANKCKKEMGSVIVLRENYDIDEPDDFFRLINTIKDDKRPARRALHALVSDVVLNMNVSHGNTHA